ncbi:MAG: adenylate/guanylate cyclase domain-containing protein [Actinobacteria bacterium]|nr:MAG: adenylate/guanylate cyclase domain-containing protein [Actinomycetota bacterium]
MATLPGGTVTFLFTDIEGSTRLLQELGDSYGEVVRDHRRLLRENLGDKGGAEVDTQGDAFFYSFTRARDAVAGAVAAQRALTAHEWPQNREVRVRMGLHTGEPSVGDEGYLGLDVVRAARICSAGHGGQVLLSETTRALLGNDLPEGASVVDLGQQHLKDVQHERIYQLAIDGDQEFPPLKTHAPKSASDELGERIERHVLDMVEASLSQGKGKGKAKGQVNMLRFTVIGLIELLLVVLTLVIIVWLVKTILF